MRGNLYELYFIVQLECIPNLQNKKKIKREKARAGTQWRNLEAGSDAYAMEQLCLLSMLLLCSFIYCRPSTQRQQYSQQIGPLYISHQSGKSPTDLPKGNLMESVSKFRLFFQITLACVQMTEKKATRTATVQKSNNKPQKG